MNFKSRIYSYFFVLILSFIYTQPVLAEDNKSVWDVLRSQFSLNHETSRPEVQKQIRWIMAHPEYMQKLSKSEPFIYHIATEVKNRRLPGELALLPMIESSFNPFAYSRAGASGLWQIMPGTGREFGLKQNWWSDSRRGVSSSTKAALHYLTYLKKYFRGNWTLAIAAYDAGEGSITRSISRSNKGKADFWSLPLAGETKAYIPKLLALSEVIQNPNKYHVKLPNIEHKPYFKEVNIGSQIDLDNAAKLAGISYQELIKLNPEHNRSATSPDAPFNLLIPVKNVDRFKQNLMVLPKNQRLNWSRHKVNVGDNLQTLAKMYNTSPSLIQEQNKLKTTSIKKEQFILIGNKDKVNLANIASTAHFSEPKNYKVVHIVDKNDTYDSLQKKYKVSKKELITWNKKLSKNRKILPGQSIVIWKQTKVHATYKVRRGDNLSTIAINNHKSLRVILALNPELKFNRLKPGQFINLS